MTNRQKKYREYLKSEHWENLRTLALNRDSNRCVRCSGDDWLQVHHRCYRGALEDTLLEDLETLCRKCHRNEHGFGPDNFDFKWKEIERHFRYGRRAPVSDWKALRAAMLDDSYWGDFADLMLQYVLHVLAHERNKEIPDFWMKPEIYDHWRERAFRLRDRLRERMK